MDNIANKYQVLKTLGQGAMGEVYLVLPPRGEPVALKLLKTLDPKVNKNAIDQFENEFKILKKLSHPNIGQIIDYGYDEKSQKVFFTLPWLKGTDLYEATENLSFEKCENLFVQALRAINYLHQKEIIHCDLKPGNIFVEEDKVLLIDFGLAGYWGESIVGTPTYLAPEVYQGTHHNVSSDLYAMGVIFYNCLSRSQPFSGKNLQEVYDRHRTVTPPPLNEINPNVPKYFSDIVSTLLNKKPEERFQSAAAVIEEIDAFSKTSYPVETEETLLSYLPTQSELIGRKEVVLDIQKTMTNFLNEDFSTSFHIIAIHGKKHVGKSKVVNKIKNDLQLAKISVEKAVPPLNDNDKKVLQSSKAIILEYLESYYKSHEERQSLQEFISLLEEKILSPDTSKFLLILSAETEQDFQQILKIFPQDTTSVSHIHLKPYTISEMQEYLQLILGQSEIPENFLKQFYENTEGLPGIASDLIQLMIEKGLLFDKSGRWNSDLLSELDKAFDKIELSESLEQEFEKIYADLSDSESTLINLLSICPHGLSKKQIQNCELIESLDEDISNLMDKHLVREENQVYFLYRKIFQDFVQKNLPDQIVKEWHTKLARPETGLSKKWSIYHLSKGNNADLSIKASEKLAEIYTKEGLREEAIQCYLKLINDFSGQPLPKRLEWVIEASSLLIWLDRFEDAIRLTSSTEKEIRTKKNNVNPKRFLTLIEKKGLSLLHKHDLERAKQYFVSGLKYCQKNKQHMTHLLRFENDLAQIMVIEGKHEDAIETFNKTRSIAKTLSQKEVQEITNNDLGHVYLLLGKFELAVKVLAEDIQNFSGLTNEEPLARALYSFAQTLKQLKQTDRAIEVYQECEKICRRGHYLPILLRSYNGLGNLYLIKENPDEALKYFQKALELAVHLQDNTTKAALLYNQGVIYKGQKNFALATRRLLMAIQIIENIENKLAYDNIILSQCYNELAHISYQENNAMKALSYHLERIKLAELNNTPAAEMFNHRYELAKLYIENRLKDQFLAEIEKLKSLSQDTDNLNKIDDLVQSWKEIEENNEQDATGKIAIAET